MIYTCGKHVLLSAVILLVPGFINVTIMAMITAVFHSSESCVFGSNINFSKALQNLINPISKYFFLLFIHFEQSKVEN